MIPHSQPPAGHPVTTSEAHVRAVARKHGTEPVTAGGYLYAIRSVPLLGRPLVYRAPVTS